jgi:hypothetical protein
MAHGDVERATAAPTQIAPQLAPGAFSRRTPRDCSEHVFRTIAWRIRLECAWRKLWRDLRWRGRCFFPIAMRSRMMFSVAIVLLAAPTTRAALRSCGPSAVRDAQVDRSSWRDLRRSFGAVVYATGPRVASAVCGDLEAAAENAVDGMVHESSRGKPLAHHVAFTRRTLVFGWRPLGAGHDPWRHRAERVARHRLPHDGRAARGPRWADLDSAVSAYRARHRPRFQLRAVGKLAGWSEFAKTPARAGAIAASMANNLAGVTEV